MNDQIQTLPVENTIEDHTSKPYHQRPDETDKWYDRFHRFCLLGPSRSLDRCYLEVMAERDASLLPILNAGIQTAADPIPAGLIVRHSLLGLESSTPLRVDILAHVHRFRWLLSGSLSSFLVLVGALIR